MRPLAVTLVHPPSNELGFVDNITVSGQRAWGIGGYWPKPTLLYSDDGGHSFARWRTGSEWGLRDAHFDGEALWVVGERSFAKTADAGKTWDDVKAPENECFWTIEVDKQKRWWVLGSNGLALRAPQGGTFSPVANRSTDSIFDIFIDRTSIWLMGNDGVLQRSRAGKRFVELALPRQRRKPVKPPITAMTRTPMGTLILVGDLGWVLRSTDDGATWKKISIASNTIDVEDILVTLYGIFIVGDDGSILVSHDDGLSFQGLESELEEHVWSITPCGDALLIGGEAGRVWRVERTALAAEMRAGWAKRDPEIADLAARVHEGVEGAELVLEDALRERELW